MKISVGPMTQRLELLDNYLTVAYRYGCPNWYFRSFRRSTYESEDNMHVTFGNPNVTCGNPNVTCGNPNVTSGNPNVTSGNPKVTWGNPNVTPGIFSKYCLIRYNFKDTHLPQF